MIKTSLVISEFVPKFTHISQPTHSMVLSRLWRAIAVIWGSYLQFPVEVNWTTFIFRISQWLIVLYLFVKFIIYFSKFRSVFLFARNTNNNIITNSWSLLPILSFFRYPNANISKKERFSKIFQKSNSSYFLSIYPRLFGAVTFLQVFWL